MNCEHCGWPQDEHEFDTQRCPDYSTLYGWYSTTYEPKIVTK